MSPSFSGPKRAAALLVCAAALCLGAAFLLKPPPRCGVPVSTLVGDRAGGALRLTVAADGQYRLWTPLEEFAPLAVEALLFKEDRGFWWSPGVDAAAICRAAWHSWALGDYRSGASTIEMQAARLLWRLDTRRAPGKLLQMGAALALRAGLSKRGVLELYLNLAPCGGNVQGLGTASRIYFGKPPSRLSAPEALALAVLPQDPASRNPGAEEGRAAIAEARDRLYRDFSARRPDLASRRAEFELPLSFRRDLPFRAPQFCEALLAAHPGVPRLATTLDPACQDLAERVVRRWTERNAGAGADNAAALLVRADSMEVLAYVGSADFGNPDIDGQVDGTAAPRSPGSTLKPFIYALALEQGLIQPLSVLKDARLRFGGYNPDNFDDDFEGPVRAVDALTASRNVPAVYLASKLRRPDPYGFLSGAGVKLPFPREHYGLSLVLGGAEVTMQDLVYLYGALALPGGRAGTAAPLRFLSDGKPPAPRRLLDARSAWLVRRMLETKARPDAGQGWNAGSGAADSASELSRESGAPGAVAYKTGTSIGFRDAWSVGIFDGYILAVWVGDFRGRGNPEYMGLRSAAPLMFEIVDALRAGAVPGPAPVPDRAPEGLARLPVCAVSGELPGPHCGRLAMGWFLPGVSPVGVCSVHREYQVDRLTGLRRSRAIPGATEARVYEVWPADLMDLFSRAGLSRVSPPPPDPADGDFPDGPGFAGAEAGNLGTGAPAILSPARGISYVVAPGGGADRIPFVSAAGSDARRVWWFVDGALAGSSARSVPLYWTPVPGRHRVRAVDDEGRASETTVDVELRAD